VLALLVVGCRSYFADGVASATFSGRAYAVSLSRGFQIRPEDLSPVGNVTEINYPADGDTVYALSGVSVEEVVVMRARGDAGVDYLMLYATNGTRPLGSVPGLCGYVPAQEEPPILCPE
jgi:hypothetical protein